ncbi:MAG: glycerophosphodiester phosphodiesterase [Elusimicrobia bacterium]|nr:glycerophosphodiester phosphodiesterase [Elusimicrobiota bacterium]
MSPLFDLEKKSVLIIGHRGAMGHGPENTRAAFEAGLRCGAGAVECDVHLSKDGRLVVIHDDRVDRTTNGRGAVAGKTWVELRLLDAGAWFGKEFVGERVWRLEDLLGWAKRRRTRFKKPLQLIIEIKAKPRSPARIADRVVAVLRSAGMVRRAIVISFNHAEAARAKALCPRLRTGLLFSQTPRDLPRRMARTHADAVFPRFALVTPEFMQAARHQGWYVGTWTVNEIPDMKRLVGLRVNAIASNFPERLVRLVCA